MKTYLDQLNKNKLEIQDFQNAAKLVEDNQGGLSQDEAKELKNLLNANKNDLIANNEQIKKTLWEEINKNSYAE